VIQLLRVSRRASPASRCSTGGSTSTRRELREGRDGYGNVTHMLYVDSAVSQPRRLDRRRVLTEDRHGIVQGLPHDLPPEIFRARRR
jgi:hypothetical protein